MSALLNTIQASLKKNQKVQLAGFGTFLVTKRAARKGVNPRTGEAIKIKASKSVRFKAGRTLKEAVCQIIPDRVGARVRRCLPAAPPQQGKATHAVQNGRESGGERV